MLIFGPVHGAKNAGALHPTLRICRQNGGWSEHYLGILRDEGGLAAPDSSGVKSLPCTSLPRLGRMEGGSPEHQQMA